MFARTRYFLSPLLRSPISPCSFFKMPFYAVIMGTNNTATITEDWKFVQILVDIFPDVRSTKFDTEFEAQCYAISCNCRMVELFDKNIELKHDVTILGLKKKLDEENVLKRKRDEEDAEIKQHKSMIKNHIQKIKMAFNNLQVAISSIPELPSTCPEEIQTLNDKVAFKLHNILKIKKKEIQENDSPSTSFALDEHQGPSKESQPSSTPSSSSSNTVATSVKPNAAISTDNILSPSDKEKAIKTFSYNLDNEVIVYCDGACSNNGNKDASAGAGVWFGNNHILNMSVKIPNAQTNNAAELYSTVHAIERVKATGLSRINIRTDSQFVIKSVTEWIRKWRINGWKTAGGSEVKNKLLFAILLENVESMESCTWTHIPAHKGVRGNEEADKLAKAATRM